MRFLTAVALAVVMLWVPVGGVAQGYTERLKGITEISQQVVPAVLMTWWGKRDLPAGINGYLRTVEETFELGLMRTGLKLIEPLRADHSLYCQIEINGPTTTDWVIRSLWLELWEWVEVTDINGNPERLNVRTWKGSGSVKSGSRATVLNLMNGKADGELCVETFELEWRRANN